MKVSKLNIAVLVQFAGVLVLGFALNNTLRAIGAVIVIVGGVLYRREKQQLKLAQASAPVAPADPGASSDS